MNIEAILYGLGSSTLFASRAFVPAFLTAVTLRFGSSLPHIKDLPILQGTGGEPIWFTSWPCILILGLLSALEIAANKNSEAEELLNDIEKYAKTGMSILTVLGVMQTTDRNFLEKTLLPAQEAGFFQNTLALLTGGLVYYLSLFRAVIREHLFEGDEDDDLGIRSLLSWFEDIWAIFGVWILLLYPIVMTFLVAISLGVVTLLRKYFAYREEKSKHPCPKCGTPVYPTAMACPNCHTPNDDPKDVGLLGGARQYTTPDREAHPFKLAEKRRCPVCATRLKERSPRQACPACGHQLFADPAFCSTYVSRVTSRLPKVLIICVGWSLIPVLGLIPGMICYRLLLVSPFRRYLPLGRRVLLKWGIRILFFILIAVQWIPGAGGVVVPLMAFVSYTAYRAGFTTLLGTEAKG